MVCPETGTNDDDDLVSASWWRNFGKGDQLPSENGRDLHAAGDLDQWDGLSGWFQRYVEAHPALLTDSMVRGYRDAAQRLALPR